MLKQALTATLLNGIKNGTITETHARLLASLPLVEIGDLHASADTEWSRYVADYPTRDFANIDRTDFIFLSAVYEVPRYGFYYLHIKPESVEINQKFECRIEYYPTGYLEGNMLSADVAYDGGSAIPLNILKSTIKAKTPLHDSKQVIVDMVSSFLTTTKIFTRFQDSLDRYPVHVSSMKPRLSRGNLNRIDVKLKSIQDRAPRLIYLNQLPYPTSPADRRATGPSLVETSRAGHQRVGHWRTLTADRYKDNPKYGIPNGVRIKPMWIGNRTVVYQGNVYTVYLKDDEVDRNG